MIIAVDFDGTLCENKFPEIGEPNESVISELKTRQKNGDHLILWTCRSEDKLEAAVHWCEEHGLIFDCINENLPEVIEAFGEDCRKITAQEYWDDRAVRVGFPHPDLNVIFEELADWMHRSKMLIRNLSFYSKAGGIYAELSLSKSIDGKTFAIHHIFYLGGVMHKSAWKDYQNNLDLDKVIKDLNGAE